ncbi:hypothetical protein PIB30_016614 [Stylosanthes scabra]|uniref:Uncharacterized protein n=1 Tax=Stylosanthes scabra TaxID=79078 RepID=A0ABU6U6Q2_9FABA|nr:hypothetical protein [Stylosanthes scabra]
MKQELAISRQMRFAGNNFGGPFFWVRRFGSGNLSSDALRGQNFGSPFFLGMAIWFLCGLWWFWKVAVRCGGSVAAVGAAWSPYGAIVLLKSAINWGCAFVLCIVCFANTMPDCMLVKFQEMVRASCTVRTDALGMPPILCLSHVPYIES